MENDPLTNDIVRSSYVTRTARLAELLRWLLGLSQAGVSAGEEQVLRASGGGW